MKFNKNIILLMIAIFLFSITGVCASEMDDSIANDDANIMELSVDDEISVDNMQISEDNDETVSTQADADVVSTNPGNYSGLSAEIGSGGNITLTHDYYTYDSSSTILITNPGVIDGKGAIIDMAGSTIQAFRVNASGVTIKNLTIKNTNYDGDGGAIFFDNCTGTVTDCNFINNSVSGDGSAIYFDNSAGTVENCNFADNIADYGGAVYFEGNGNLINCNFTANQARFGGAVYFLNNGNVAYCNFTRNKADNDAGAIWISWGSVENCNLINNSVITDYSGGGAIFVYDNANITHCNFINNSVIDENCDGGAVYINNNANIINCNFTKNTATSQGGAVYVSRNANITNCNFINNSVIDEDCDGGALYINEGTVAYCNFTKNTATSEGGAVYVYGDVNITDCNFINNSATINGGAVYLNGKSNVINSNFTGNKANNSGAVYFYRTGNVVNSYFNDNEADTGGAIYFLDEGDVKNSKFTGNKADDGGAVYFNTKGNVQNSNFADNSATGDSGAVYFYSTGNVTNCTFINNSASNGGAIEFERTGALTNSYFTDNKADYGGAVYFNTNFNVENCNFSGNEADYGGATYFNTAGTLTNSNFTDNKADYGGAVYFKFNGKAVNCNFINNSATHYGGAIEFDSDADIINSNFTHNKADYGGAVYIDEQGDLSNCNFTANNATAGSAIYFNSTQYSKIIYNSNFLKNRANVDDNTPFNVTFNGNNIEIIFIGQNNFLNAIYSPNQVIFYNVNYWGASGITNINDVSLGSKNEAGQNITVRGVVNGNIVNAVYITDENGKIVIKDITGDYYITVRHDEDSYYTEAEKIIKNMDFYANVTSMTTNNRTVNLTVKSNIYNEVMPGKLLFNLPNGIAIDANYSSNGAWWIVYEFDNYDVYQVGASYVGLDGVTISNGTVTITKADSQITLDDIVLDYGDSINVNVTTKGATAITAKINNNDVNVINNYTIQISDLASGNYTLTVTTTPDEDHNQVTKTVNVTVNKVNSTLTFDNVVLDYGESKNVSVTAEGAAGIVAKIDGKDVSVDGFTILISDLKAGNHTLTVVSVPDENHTEVTKNATVTLN
ncbi:beta strand repeat-containing protein [Methanobrevibacter sp.]